MALLNRLGAAWSAFMNFSPTQSPSDNWPTHDERIARYAEHIWHYRGYVSRFQNSRLDQDQTKRLRYNLCQPICNMGAAWAAGPELAWQVRTGNKEFDKLATQAATDIWNRSEGNSEFQSACLTAAIYGDMVAMPQVTPEGVRIQFIDPCVCYPTFSPHDCSRLDELVIAYNVGRSKYSEKWTAGSVEVRGPAGDTPPVAFKFADECPAVWIPNMAVTGQPTGDSDLEASWPLILEYDHLCQKQTRIIDYYSNPTVVASGIKKGDADLEKGIRTVFYLPNSEAKVYYLEWQGTPPSTDEHLTRTRETICQVSETPPIAFGMVDSGFRDATGVGLKVLFAPLEAKTRRKRAIWGPRLSRVMAMALRAEGIEVEAGQVDAVFAESAPHNEGETLSNLLIEKQLGASESALLAKAGYDEDDIEKMRSERDDQAEADSRRQQQIFSRGAPVDDPNS